MFYVKGEERRTGKHTNAWERCLCTPVVLSSVGSDGSLNNIFSAEFFKQTLPWALLQVVWSFAIRCLRLLIISLFSLVSTLEQVWFSVVLNSLKFWPSQLCAYPDSLAGRTLRWVVSLLYFDHCDLLAYFGSPPNWSISMLDCQSLLWLYWNLLTGIDLGWSLLSGAGWS